MGAPRMGQPKLLQRPLLVFLLAFAAIVFVQPVLAQAVWDGSDSTDWFVGSNWSGNQAPNAGRTGTIDTTTNAPVISTAGAVASDLRIGSLIGTTGSLTVTGAGTLSVPGFGSGAGPYFFIGGQGNGSLTVEAGGTVTAGAQTYVAEGSFGNGVGNLTITGAGSSYAANGGLYIGSDFNAQGTVNVEAGASLTGDIRMGTFVAGSNSTLNVDGAGTTVTTVNFLTVGDFGSGTVNISNNATVSSNFTTLGGTATGDGTVNISSGATLTGGSLTVGSIGEGELTIDTGGHFTGSTVTIGSNDTGTATVTGAGSTLTSSASLHVGASSTGELTIEDGAVVTSRRGRLGSQSAGTGTVTVTGIGSVWNVQHATDGDLLVGENGDGVLNIEDGGVVNARSLIAAGVLGTTGDIAVTGAGSELNVDTVLRVGIDDTLRGTGSLSILNGGAVTVGGGAIGDYLTASNSTDILVDGAGSLLTITQGIIVGNSSTPSYLRLGKGGTNSLTVSNGGAVSLDRSEFITTATSSVAVVVTGATTTWTSNTFEVGGAGTASFTIDDGATVDVLGQSFSAAVVNGTAAAAPTLTISTGGHLTVDDALRVGTTNKGTLLVDTGGQLTAGTLDLASNTGSTATATFTGAGTAVDAALLQVGLGGVASLTVENGAALTTSTTWISNGDTMTVTDTGTIWSTDGSSSVDGSLTIENGADMIGIGIASLHVDGNAVVTDAGTTVSSMNLWVGDSSFGGAGTGDLQILAGATFAGSRGYIGAERDGQVTIDGAGSSLTMSDTLRVGIGEDGTLDIVNNGTVTSLNGHVGTQSSSCGCGGTGGGTGTVNVTGSGALWTITQDAIIGDVAEGHLNITAGGDVTSTTAIIGDDAGSDGVALVTGAGSTWTNSGSFTIGNDGEGLLTVAAGGTVTTTGAATIGADGMLAIGSGGVAGTFTSPAITNNGIVRFNHTGVVTFVTAMSGTGGVTKDAAGTTILTGNNTITGTTRINAGILQLGNGGTTGSVGGDIVNNALLAVDRTNAVTLIGDISGSGALEQAGTGTLILTGTGAYTGGTTIAAGTLQLGSGGATGSITGNVVNDGTLIINRSNQFTFAGVISGSGTLRQDGTGTTILTGTSNYTGTTTVSAGTLIVNGDIATSQLTVLADGTLGGNGTVGPATIEGIVAPGNSIGILTGTGDYLQATDSLYLVEIDDSPASDLIAASGTATIEAGARLEVEAAAGTYATLQRYTILTATGGVTGTYTADFTAPFLDMALIYDPNAVYLDVVRSEVPFAEVAETPNQKAAAAGLESLDPASALPTAIVPLSADDARDAFDQLSGEAHASLARVLIEDSRIPREAALDRIDAAFAAIEAGKRPGEDAQFWLRSLGSVGVVRADGNAAEIVQGSGGLIAGADIMMGDLLLGVEAGFTGHQAGIADRNSSASATGVHAGIYGGTRHDALRVDFGAAISGYGVRVERDPAFTGFADDVAASYAALTVQAFSEIGYAIELSDVTTIEPFLRVAIVGHGGSRYAETGGPSVVSGAVDPNLSVVATLGLSGSTELVLGDGLVVEARGRVGWEQHFGGAPTATHAFAGGDPFTVSAPGHGSGVVAEGSIGIPLNDFTRIDASLGTQFGPSGPRAAATLTLSGQF